ncbi:MAG: adenylyl-sulfate kinase [Thermoprotei archaeon]|nr:MAG: adenylyl-sulfate kinase [Thermoprotei archaeon]
MDKAPVVWFTGLPASGKTAVASRVAEELRSRGLKVELLDGDWVRRTINPDAGFTREQRRLHLLRVAWVARLLARNGVVVLCSFVSPYRDVRGEVRRIVEEEGLRFVEVYVKCSLETCMRRDPKGLYRRALAGEVKHMTGLDDPYEPPLSPEVAIDTENEGLEECARKVLVFLEPLLKPY